MSFFSTKMLVVPIDEDNRVTVRSLSHGEKQQLLQKATKTQRVYGRAGQEGESEAIVDVLTMQQEALYKRVVSWEGPGFLDEKTGELCPCNQANINALPTWVVDKIVEGINTMDNTMNEPITAAEKNGLTPPTSA